MSPTDARAVALSSFDVPNGHELLVRSCEDCACPVSREHDMRPRIVKAPAGELVRARHVLELPLGEYSVLFNPAGNGGVVVVNAAARRIYDAFRESCSVGELVAAGQDE